MPGTRYEDRKLPTTFEQMEEELNEGESRLAATARMLDSIQVINPPVGEDFFYHNGATDEYWSFLSLLETAFESWPTAQITALLNAWSQNIFKVIPDASDFDKLLEKLPGENVAAVIEWFYTNQPLFLWNILSDPAGLSPQKRQLVAATLRERPIDVQALIQDATQLLQAVSFFGADILDQVKDNLRDLLPHYMELGNCLAALDTEGQATLMANISDEHLVDILDDQAKMVAIQGVLKDEEKQKFIERLANYPDKSWIDVPKLRFLLHNMAREARLELLTSMHDRLPDLIKNKTDLSLVLSNLEEAETKLVLKAIQYHLPDIAKTPEPHQSQTLDSAKQQLFEQHLTAAQAPVEASDKPLEEQLEHYVGVRSHTCSYSWFYVRLLCFTHWLQGKGFSMGYRDDKVEAAQDLLNIQQEKRDPRLRVFKIETDIDESTRLPAENRGQYIYTKDDDSNISLYYVSPRDGKPSLCEIKPDAQEQLNLWIRQHANEPLVEISEEAGPDPAAEDKLTTLQACLKDTLPTTRQAKAMRQGKLKDIIKTQENGLQGILETAKTAWDEEHGRGEAPGTTML